jgi:hypothetical protein
VHQNVFLHYNANLLVSGEHFQHLMWNAMFLSGKFAFNLYRTGI